VHYKLNYIFITTNHYKKFDKSKVVLRVVIPRAFLKPELPIIAYEFMIKQEKEGTGDYLSHFYKTVKEFENPGHSEVLDLDTEETEACCYTPERTREQILLKQIEHKIKKIKQLEHQYGLSDDQVRIGLRVKLKYVNPIPNPDKTKYPNEIETPKNKIKSKIGEQTKWFPPQLGNWWKTTLDNYSKEVTSREKKFQKGNSKDRYIQSLNKVVKKKKNIGSTISKKKFKRRMI